MKNKLFVFQLVLGILFCSSLLAQENQSKAAYPLDKPVFQVDTPFPTSDKPQSKLWYMKGYWWAILPKSSGPSLWQRKTKGWIEYTDIGTELKGVPGHVDIWANKKEVTVVGVDKHFLKVFRLKKKARLKTKWKAQILTTLLPPSENNEIETATIVQDENGRWWVAADAGGKICVWSSVTEKGKQWSKPYVIADGLDTDDICSITIIPGGVGVIWSDQVQEAVNFRIHKDDQPIETWEEVVTIEAGNKTADDHINAALSSNGTLWIATKNSVDMLGKPQQVLRVRSRTGQWSNFPYAILEPFKDPSRPIVIATENPKIVLAGHTIYNTKNRNLGEIVFGLVDTTQLYLLRDLVPVIKPDTTGWMDDNRINDVTGPKKPFSMKVPWIVLASDNEGRIYEADLKSIFLPKIKN